MSGEGPQVHVCVATPCFTHAVFVNYLSSVIGLVHAFRDRGLTLSFILRGGDGVVTRCRNSIVAEFLATPGYTHLLWIDADIGFEPGAVFRLLASGHEVVAGVYPFKDFAWPERVEAGMTGDALRAALTRYSFNPLATGASVSADGFAEVLDVPAGFMLVARAAFERIIAGDPALGYKPDAAIGIEHLTSATAAYHYRFFDAMTDATGRYVADGHAFCRRWQAAGGRVYIDVRSRLTHHGVHLYEGDLMAALRGQAA